MLDSLVSLGAGVPSPEISNPSAGRSEFIYFLYTPIQYFYISPMGITFDSADPSKAELFFEHRQDPVTQQFNPLQKSSIEDLRIKLSKSSSDLSEFEKAESFFWFISQNQTIIGTASMRNINRMMLTAEIGYGVFAHARNQGIASKIVQTLTSRAFSETNLRKLIAYVHEGNLASRRVLEKAGYIKEGILREHYLIAGEPVNEVVYGILRREVT